METMDKIDKVYSQLYRDFKAAVEKAMKIAKE